MIKITKEEVLQFKKLISENSNVVIVNHVNPDGDSVGSALALGGVLKKFGHNVTIISPNKFPSFLQWLPGFSEVLIYTEEATEVKDSIRKSDLIINLDFNNLERAAGIEKHIEKSKSKKILIDHHPNPQEFSDLTISRTEASSTAELLYLVLKEAEFEKYIDKHIAECLFAGLMTDTGAFRYSTDNPQTFIVAAELIKFGIDRDNIYDKIYNNFSADRMRLMGYCLNTKMEVFEEYNTAIISITVEELKRFNSQNGDTEGFVNLPLAIKGIEFAALFIEKSNSIKMSFRSKGKFNVSKFAVKHFNGGGHKMASGGNEKVSLDESIKKFKGLLIEYKNELN